MNIREVASGLQFPEGPVVLEDGAIAVVEIARGRLTRVDPHGKTTVIATPGGGPNGAAIGPDGKCYVCNSGGFEWRRNRAGQLRPVGRASDYSGGRIERIDLSTGRVERIYEEAPSEEGTRTLSGPNDLVFDASGGFWFTDLGGSSDRRTDRSAIYYAATSGQDIREIPLPIVTPNGIGLGSEDGALLIADTEAARIWSFNLIGPGQIAKQEAPAPHGARFIRQAGGNYQRFDSLAVDCEGSVLVGTLIHGGITQFSSAGLLMGHIPLDDPYVTNLCFGGKDMRTLYVTLSGTGRLIAIDDWPVPGKPLHFQLDQGNRDTP